VNGMPAEKRKTCAPNHNGCRTVGKDIPPVYKLYCWFVSPHVLDLSPSGCEDTVKGMRNLTEKPRVQGRRTKIPAR
jgi:hypothetical protein